MKIILWIKKLFGIKTWEEKCMGRIVASIKRSGVVYDSKGSAVSKEYKAGSFSQR